MLIMAIIGKPQKQKTDQRVRFHMKHIDFNKLVFQLFTQFFNQSQLCNRFC